MDTEKNQEVQEDPSPKGLGGASRLEDGGPAFPCEPRSILNPDGMGATFIVGSQGLSLRDYFAAKAMQGELSAQGLDFFWRKADDLASRSFLIADAMLKARKVGAA